MKTICKATILFALAAVTLTSCSKKNTVAPVNNISLVAGDWVTDDWGGTKNDILVFTVYASTDNAKVANLYGSGYGFSTGDVIYSNIKANADGTYSCTASYSANGSGTLSTRAATMSLQNGNTQLTVSYPALNASFPAITYVFQQTSNTIIAL